MRCLARNHFGRDVGYEVLIETYLSSEVSNGCSYLRDEGLVESVGSQWKLKADMEPEDKEIVMTRRDKRLRGELKAQIRMAHEAGDTEAAIKAADMLQRLGATEEPVETPEKELSPKAKAKRNELEAIIASVKIG